MIGKEVENFNECGDGSDSEHMFYKINFGFVNHPAYH